MNCIRIKWETLTDRCCMCFDCPIAQPLPYLLPFLGSPQSLRHNSIERRLVTNPTVVSKCSSERKSQILLTLNQKLEMIKFHEQDILRAKVGQKLGLLSQIISQVVNVKEKFLKKVKSTLPVNMQMIRKQNSLFADMEKLRLVWIEGQTSHGISLSKHQTQERP